MNDEWIDVDGSDDIPEGEWLAEMQEPNLGSKYAIVVKRPIVTGFLVYINGGFHFDKPKVIRYRPIPL
jgi:hypothetical protein